MPKSEEYQKKKHQLFEVVITNNEEISPGVYLISWKRNSDFIPGQVVKIAMSEND